MKISCFLPCRAGSERVPRKNIKPFANYQNGLIEIKLKQLNACKHVDQIVLSTNDNEIIRYASALSFAKLKIHVREERLSSSATSTDELVKLAHDITDGEHIVWTHVTSPFYSADLYDSAIQKYFSALSEGYDSLMSVKELRSFIWGDNGPLNYDRGIEKWPRTQTLKPLYEIDSGIFINSRKNYELMDDRIGHKPYLMVSPGNSGFDIDWPEDFSLAESMLTNGVAAI